MQLENTDQLKWWQISASISFSNMTPSAAALHSELHGWSTLLPKATAWIRNPLKASMAFTWLKLFVSTKTHLNWIFSLTKAHFCMLGFSIWKHGIRGEPWVVTIRKLTTKYFWRENVGGLLDGLKSQHVCRCYRCKNISALEPSYY